MTAPTADIRHELVYLRTHGVSAAPRLFERYARDVVAAFVFQRAELAKARARIAELEADLAAARAV